MSTRFPLQLPTEQQIHQQQQQHEQQQYQASSRREQIEDGQQAAETDPSAFFFPILPYGYVASVDLTGWTLPSSGLSISSVWDHEAGSDVVEVLAGGHKSASSGGGAGLVRTQDTLGRSSALINTARGGHSLVDAVRVQGATGGASAVDTTLSQRLKEPDFAAAAARLPQVSFTAGMVPTSPPAHGARGSSTAARGPASTAPSSSASVAALEFPHPSQFIGTALPILNVQLKSLSKFVSLDVEVEDTRGRLYTLTMSNAQSLVRLRLDGASLPLTLRPGWNRLTLDLAHLTATCFNARFAQAHRVRVHASCRLRRIFFSDTSYPDFALPPSMRVYPDEVYDAKRFEDDERKRAAEQQQQRDV